MFSTLSSLGSSWWGWVGSSSSEPAASAASEEKDPVVRRFSDAPSAPCLSSSSDASLSHAIIDQYEPSSGSEPIALAENPAPIASDGELSCGLSLLGKQEEPLSPRRVSFELIFDEEGNTELHRTMRCNQTFDSFEAFLQALEKLLQKGGDADLQNKDGDTALHLVDQLEGADIDVKLEKILMLFLRCEANIHLVNHKRESVLHKICSQWPGAVLSIKRVLAENPDLNAIDINGHTPLHRLLLSDSDHRLRDAASLLIQQGAKINLPSFTGDTPLHLAIQKKKTAEEIEFLLKNEADPMARNGEGLTPLRVLLECEDWGVYHLEVCTLLMRYTKDDS